MFFFLREPPQTCLLHIFKRPDACIGYFYRHWLTLLSQPIQEKCEKRLGRMWKVRDVRNIQRTAELCGERLLSNSCSQRSFRVFMFEACCTCGLCQSVSHCDILVNLMDAAYFMLLSINFANTIRLVFAPYGIHGEALWHLVIVFATGNYYSLMTWLIFRTGLAILGQINLLRLTDMSSF